MRARLSRLLGALAELAGRRIRTVPGLAGGVCAVVGSTQLWGGPVALLVAAGLLLILSWELH